MAFISFICQNQNSNIFILKVNKKGASQVFDEIKIKKTKVASSVFWEIKNKNVNLPASSVFQKSGLRNTCLFLLALPTYFSLRLEKYLNDVAFLEKALKIIFPLKSP